MLERTIECLLAVIALLGVMIKFVGSPETLDIENLQNICLGVLCFWTLCVYLPKVARKFKAAPIEDVVSIAMLLGVIMTVTFVMEITDITTIQIMSLVGVFIIYLPLKKFVWPWIYRKLASKDEQKTDDSRARE